MSFLKKFIQFFMGEKKEDKFERDLKEVKKLSKKRLTKKADVSWIDYFKEEVEIEKLKRRSLRSLVEEEYIGA